MVKIIVIFFIVNVTKELSWKLPRLRVQRKAPPAFHSSFYFLIFISYDVYIQNVRKYLK